MLKKIQKRLVEKLIWGASFFFPIRWKNYTSAVNGNLEITIVDGKKVLNTTVSNYSYGSLQRILRYALKKIHFEKTNLPASTILLLGLGGGSIIATIREEFNSQAAITAVDIDAKIIEIAQNDFAINRFENVHIIQDDAYHYLQHTKETFDYIVVDLFIGNKIPTVFTTPTFIMLLSQHLRQGGKIIYNTIRKTMPSRVFEQVIQYFLEQKLTTEVLKNVEGTNSLIIATKN